MGKMIDLIIREKTFKIFDRLPYRLACQMEVLQMEMMADVDFPDDDEELVMKDLVGLNFEKKTELMDLLLIEAVRAPNITLADLNDYDHEFQDYFKELADELVVRYMEHWAEANKEKKKLNKSSN